MLSTITMTIENDPYAGSIRLISEANVSSVSGVTGIDINRKPYGESWAKIKSIAVESVDDLAFNIIDITTKPKKEYSYSIDIKNGDSIIESQTYNFVECWFDGVLVGNNTKLYIAESNISIDESINTQVSYVTTLEARTPYRVSNANTKYSVVSVSGLFLKLTNDKKKFIPDVDYSYAKEVIDFLLDGTSKIIKDSQGRIWFASIDNAVSLQNQNGYSGYDPIQFSFTEIGDVPVIDYVIEVQ